MKVTYFLVGRMATAYPDVVRRIYNSGHSVGTHSQNHPPHLQTRWPCAHRARSRRRRRLGADRARRSTSHRAVLQNSGLLRDKQVDSYPRLATLAVWSADEVADDWYKGITPQQIVSKAISRIEGQGPSRRVAAARHPPGDRHGFADAAQGTQGQGL
ncbi:MAG: polysaccharide deacetylase family protein [Pseudolabrys sp.]